MTVIWLFMSPVNAHMNNVLQHGLKTQLFLALTFPFIRVPTVKS